MLGLDQDAAAGEWVHVFFDAGGWSWASATGPPAEPEGPAGELRFPATDLAATVAVAAAQITSGDVVARDGPSGRLLLGFATGTMISVEHEAIGRTCRSFRLPPNVR